MIRTTMLFAAAACWAARPARAGDSVPPASPDFVTGVQTLGPTTAHDALVPVPFENGAEAPSALQTVAGEVVPAEALLGPDAWSGIPDLMIDHLALDWGVANLGEPVLAPAGGAVGGSGGGRSPASAGGGQRQNARAAPIVETPPGSEPLEPPQQVPEPGALLLWGTLAVAIALRRAAG